MTTKLFCPHCGRCVGECQTYGDTGACKILIAQPTKVKEKHFIHSMKCCKCKEKIFILMEFDD